jgi:hypothetical protein
MVNYIHNIIKFEQEHNKKISNIINYRRGEMNHYGSRVDLPPLFVVICEISQQGQGQAIV